jgi:hypothetical protein
MSEVYIVEPGGQQTSYKEEQAWGLWNQGAISEQALYWKQNMPEWRPVREMFGDRRSSSSALPIISTAPVTGFAKDPTRLTKALKVLLWISVGAAVFGVISGVASLATGNAAKADSDEFTLMDGVELLSGLFSLGTFIITGVLFLMWIHRANRNVRALGAEGMKFTPGWSVGWYFIPIASLWKPYQAMKEIWQASHNPKLWTTQELKPIVNVWWTLWLLSNILGNASLRTWLRAHTPEALVAAEAVSLFSDLVDIPLCLVAIKLVSTIYQRQSEWAKANSNQPIGEG